MTTNSDSLARSGALLIICCCLACGGGAGPSAATIAESEAPPAAAPVDAPDASVVTPVPAAPGGEADAGGGPPGQSAQPLTDEPAGLQCLREAFAGFVERIEADTGGNGWTVTLQDGTRLPWDDGIADKTFEQLLDRPDLQDMFSISYPPGKNYEIPKENDDPGRIRVEPLFESVYGADAAAVRANLTDVEWLPSHGGRKLRFNRVNGAAEALRAVSAELDRLPDRLIEYLLPSGGTFNWRKIAGTRRLSVHSFAIAIDINVKHSDYWRWGMKRSPTPFYRNQIPLEIVEVFERHGFVWGGKWFHYDTMHFEYRPELLHPACLRVVEGDDRGD
jgi:hypothetical protein